MSIPISKIRGIGPLDIEIFSAVGFYTVEDLKSYNLESYNVEKHFMDMMKSVMDKDHLSQTLKCICKRCVNIIIRVRNVNALPFDPYHFICPITQYLMSDPVIAPSGISYERADIEEWLLSNTTEPNKKTALTIEQLYPNPYLLECIEHYRNNYEIYHKNDIILL